MDRKEKKKPVKKRKPLVSLRTILFWVILLLILSAGIISGILIWGPSDNKGQMSAYGSSWNDVSNFRKSISEMGVGVNNIVSSPMLLDTLNNTMEIHNTLFISLGVEKEYTLSEAWSIYKFFLNGGKIIIADDFGYGNSISNKDFSGGWDGFGLEFSNAPLYDGRYVKNPLFVTIPINSMDFDYDFKGTYLFTLNSEYSIYLANGPIIPELKNVIIKNGLQIANEAKVTKVGESTWQITDVDLYNHYREYRLELTAEGVEVYSYTVVLNKPSAFVPSRGKTKNVLATSSGFDIEDNFPLSWLDKNGNGERDIAESTDARRYPGGYPLMYELTSISDDGKRGKALFISDPSLFINDMWEFNEGFCEDLVRYMLGEEELENGDYNVVFDESRHFPNNVVTSFRQELYFTLVFLFTETNLRILTPVIIIMFLLVVIIAVDDPLRRRHIYNIRHKTIYNLHNQNIRSGDSNRIRHLLLEKVRLALGVSKEDFRQINTRRLKMLLNDDELIQFLLGPRQNLEDRELEDILIKIRDWIPGRDGDYYLD